MSFQDFQSKDGLTAELSRHGCEVLCGRSGDNLGHTSTSDVDN